MTSRAKFIVFEGIDGSGKSTQVQHLAEYLGTKGMPVFCTGEPTKSTIGKMIRSVLTHHLQADQRTIAALFAADRLQHILDEEEGILKKCNEGVTVLCDRYYFSSFAYHTVYTDLEWVIALNSKSMELLKPDLNIFIDIDPAVALERIHSNRSHTEIFEHPEMLLKVKDNYEKAFDVFKTSERIVRIDGNRDAALVSADVIREVEKIL